jgi:acetyl esterase/lipase
LIYFQGGGACWSDATCNPKLGLYRPNLKEVDPANERGIFDFANAENPFRDYFVVFVPYCTGDVHLGNRTAKYLPEKPELHHSGFNNAMSALRWAFANVASPQSIFVAGSSAGAMASPFYAGRIADHYKRGRVVQLGDSAGGLGGPVIPGIFDSWGTKEVVAPFAPYKTVDAKTANLVTLYVREGLVNESITFAQFNNSADTLQVLGLKFFGIKTPLSELLEKSYAEIRSTMPRFHTFTAPGNLHVILNRPEFYTVTVEGERLRDWVADLASGKAATNVPKSR